MKNNLSGWVQPFVFKDDQQRELLLVLPRRSAKNIEAASSFLEAAQKEVEVWLSVDMPLLSTTQKEHELKITRLKDAAVELRAALADIPADTGAALHLNVIDTLYCEPYSRNHDSLASSLKQLGYPGPLNNDLPEELLGELLDVVEESASRMATNLDVRTGVDNGKMISLAAILAGRYSECFKKEPTAGNQSYFRKFLSELSTILIALDWRLTDCYFGVQTVKDALERREEIRKQFALPPTE